MAIAITTLGESIQSVRRKDWVQTAMEIVQSLDFELEFTDEDTDWATTIFTDEQKAKMFCLLKDSNAQMRYFRREITAIQGVEE
jgi:hypothetical protein